MTAGDATILSSEFDDKTVASPLSLYEFLEFSYCHVIIDFSSVKERFQVGGSVIGTFAFLLCGNNISAENIIQIGAEKIDYGFLKLVVG